MKNLISVENVSKTFGRYKALNNVTLEIEKGEIFALLGPNGAGKSTTVRMLCTLLRPTSGVAKVGNGRTISCACKWTKCAHEQRVTPAT